MEVRGMEYTPVVFMVLETVEVLFLLLCVHVER